MFRLSRCSSRLMLCAAVLLAASACGSGGDNRGGGPGASQGRPGGGQGFGGPRAAPAVLVRVEPVARTEMAALYSTSATLRAEKIATVTARTRGVVEALMVEEGDRVRSGQVLAELENDEQTIAAARAKAEFDTQQAELERAERLFEQELIAEEGFQQTRRDMVDAKHLSELADLELSRTQIRAPFSGVILERHLDVGNTVSDGTAVYTLADAGRLLADVNVPERNVARLAPGQTVRLTPDAGEEQVEAKIERIAPAVDAETGTVKVTLIVPGGGDADLRPGSFVRSDIVTDVRPEALVVPRSALVAEGRRWLIYRVAEDGVSAEQVEIELGYENGDKVEVATTVGDGAPITYGDRIVVSGAGALSAGSQLNIEGETPPAAQNGNGRPEMREGDGSGQGDGQGQRQRRRGRRG
ncbi:MAG: efflux RND transporter periplasmic adaptor subunit [Acidobacteriota bacterium]